MAKRKRKKNFTHTVIQLVRKVMAVTTKIEMIVKFSRFGTPKTVQIYNGEEASEKSRLVFAFEVHWSIGDSNFEGYEKAEREKIIVRTSFRQDPVRVFCQPRVSFSVVIR